MQNLIAWFVRRPLLVNLIMVTVFLMGALTIADMRYEYNPHIDMGVVNITTVRAGTGPEEIELSITLPLEEELLEIDGVRNLYSNSMENLSVITLNLDLDAAPKHVIMRDIQQAVDRAVARLPADLLEKPLVDELSTLTTPVMDIHVTGTASEAVLRQVARNTGDALREVSGVASVTRLGYRRPEVRIMLEQEKLARLGINYEEIIEAIHARNLRDSGGALDSFTTEKQVIAVGQFRQPRDIEKVVIRAREPGNTVLLRDVAEVISAYEDWQIQTRIDGQLSITLRVRKNALADEVHTAANLRAFVAAAALPHGVELKVVGDVSRLTDNALEVLTGNAIVGLLAVFVLLTYFLQFRFAFWVALGIPFALCLTFLLVSALGHTINSMTLAAVILMLGILVDDAVVVSENTQYLRQQGFSAGQASILGAAQVSQPVAFSALTTVLAFTPLVLLEGSSGAWMEPFIVTVVVILLASLLESQFLLPSHLSHVPISKQPAERVRFERLRSAYQRLIERLLQRRYLTLLGFLLMFLAVVAIGLSTIRFSLFPDLDFDTVHIKIELPPGTSFEQTVAAVAELEGEFRQQVNPADLLAITSDIGHHDTNFYGATEGRDQAWALIAVQLHPLGRRSGDSTTRQLVEDLQQVVSDRTGFTSITVQPQTDLPVMGEPVEVEVVGSGDERFAIAAQLQDFVESHPAVTTVWNSHHAGKDIVDLQFNHGLLAARGLSMEQVIRAVRVAVDGLLVDELQTLDERVRYRLQLTPEQAGKLQTLENLSIINSRGQPIYLDSVADFHVRSGEANIKHYFGKRTVTVFGRIDEQKTTVMDINADIAEFVAAQNWSASYPGVRIKLSGQVEENERALGNFQLAIGVCLLAIFAALVILFNSVSQPLLVLICLPFGITGVIIGYSVQGMTMGMMAITGIIGLMGVLVNDSLVLLHAMNRQRNEKGDYLSPMEVAAVCYRRFRPIFITSLTTAVAMLPTAYGLMGENSYLKPVFMSMAWGVIFGGLVSLLLLPIMYMIDQDVRRRLGLRLPADFTAGDGAAEA
ncbi:efflux RND transporter permease subunit [Halieaceae bacterium IMCC14734]|uniref:Efflux RND transporter permease subunit n=1 Tax=Candidatus Litorirhabdus singularis TaxID=2518993 RepID=A0ABT3TGW0_9GAMM|nr:efflux RND transporter permease subunit [Candidatus Litorirhabdus singularis]MCX2981553.1 efflux RND transporter permease subunit [Candidatus Litorirhabdus singularis]